MSNSIKTSKTNMPQLAVTVTAAAQQYLFDLIKDADLALKLSVEHDIGGIKLALEYCNFKDINKYQEIICEKFSIYVEDDTAKSLNDATIDYITDKGGEQMLSINAPMLKKPAVNSASMQKRIEFFIEHEINPTLAMHGGYVKLSKLIDNKVLHLEFGGGCKGCSIANHTFQGLVSELLNKKFPELEIIEDVTEHHLV